MKNQVVFTDNNNRKLRLLELADTAKVDLNDAQKDYKEFESLLTQVNESIATAYKKAGLKAPEVSKLTILDKSQTGKNELTVTITKALLGVVTWVGAVRYLTPGATKLLVSSGVMAETTAAKVLTEFTIPLIEKRITFTIGKIAGSAIGFALGTAIVTAVEIGIVAIKESQDRDELRKGIKEVFPFRAGTRLSKRKAETLLDSLRALKTTFDVLNRRQSTKLTEKEIEDIIKEDVEPSVTKANKITAASIAEELKKDDHDNHSWTKEDPQ
ncbi:hypothetical protein SAMN05444266_109242 [Chitinophaga jiangningensis]|uniref:Uncharacterized protein n=1 Tax=Chitinophaga jiangningensis TaxID=1419482 RepID=A0A1M7KBQ8_9BACT|nr:hypothetical protein [Chitinophaga jiangningensis]SHM62729.1 hypothetical protein SAMN05444266_109242 [Chitinophaga jiangningensis]